MNLNELIKEIEEKIDEVEESLLEYTRLPVVNRFLVNREKDLRKFKKLTQEYDGNIPTTVLCGYLKQTLPIHESKIYGGICLRGAKYFEIPQYVRKAIEDNIRKAEYVQEQLDFAPDYAIPDELSKEQFNVLYC